MIVYNYLFFLFCNFAFFAAAKNSALVLFNIMAIKDVFIFFNLLLFCKPQWFNTSSLS